MRFDLQKYNRVVWAILGTLALLGLLTLLVGALTELRPFQRSRASLAVPPVPDNGKALDPPPAQELSLGFPSDIPGTGLLLVPVEGPPEERRKARGIGSYSKSGPDAPVLNLLFADPKTATSQPLLQKKALITRHEVLTDHRGDTALATALALRIVEADTNGNGKLDDGDDEEVYLCDPTGRGLRKILPTGYVCERWEYDAARKTLFLLVQTKGAVTAPTEILSVPLDASQPIKPLIAREQMEALRKQPQR
jgi:hypothetical protein